MVAIEDKRITEISDENCEKCSESVCKGVKNGVHLLHGANKLNKQQPDCLYHCRSKDEKVMMTQVGDSRPKNK